MFPIRHPNGVTQDRVTVTSGGMMDIVRTPTKALGGITPEEKVKLDAVSQEWIKVALRTDPIEPDKIVPAIEGLYAAAGLKKPRVVIVPSPMVMAFSYGAAAWIWYCRKNSATSAATDAATRAATYAATDAATDAATRAATDAATDAATRAATDALDLENEAVKAVLKLAGKGGIICAQRWYGPYQGGNMWSGWASYLAGFREVLGLRLPEHAQYQYWEDAARHGGFRVMHEEFCIVSDFPRYIKMDDQNRPHCQNGPSHEWRDGWKLYHWHGVRVPSEWIEQPESLTAEIALTWENIEQRRAACEILGWTKILEKLNAHVIDRDDDPQVGTLLECDLPDSGKEKFLQVKCGTGRDFCIPMPRNIKTALEGNLWSYGLDADRSFVPEIRT